MTGKAGFERAWWTPSTLQAHLLDKLWPSHEGPVTPRYVQTREMQ